MALGYKKAKRVRLAGQPKDAGVRHIYDSVNTAGVPRGEAGRAMGRKLDEMAHRILTEHGTDGTN